MNAKQSAVSSLILIPFLTGCAAAMGTMGPPASATRRNAGLPPTYAAATAVGSYPLDPAPTRTEGGRDERRPTPTPYPTERRAPGTVVNPFVDTLVDHLSTFALDVDTASYTRARDQLRNGRLPDPDSVRVEEFINYFDPGYPAPPDVAFAVFADGAPSPFHSDGSYLLRIGVQGYRVSDEERKPLVLTFVIDASGSMGDEGKLEMVKQALALLADRLRPSDSVAIVAYSTDAWVVLSPTNGYDHSRIKDAIYSLWPTDSTNVEAGLRLGYRLAWEAFRDGATNRVILCSDGVANTGTTDAAGILEYVGGYTRRGITLTAIGVGMGEYNDALLEQLADRGDGNYAYIDTYEEARRVMVDDLVSTLQVIALDAKIQVDFNPDVVARYRLIGYEDRAVADSDFRNDAVDAGEIGAGHSATAVYAVQFRPGASGRLATVQLRWEDPDDHSVREINGNFNTWDLAAGFDAASPRFRLAAVVTQFAEILRGSPWASPGQLGLLGRYAGRLTETLSSDEDVRDLAGLIAAADRLMR
jgi:Ca-activated chloride channel family protein